MKQKVLGWICLIIGLTPFLTFVFTSNSRYVVWFSNHTFIILGLAVLFNSRFWVLAELSLGLIPELVWSVDYLWRLLSGRFLFGITDYMFTSSGGFAWNHLYSLQHVLFVPVALYAFFKLEGSYKHAWAGSVVHGAALLGLARLFPVDYNLNCAYYSCLPFSIPYYPLIWPLFILALVFVSYGLISLLSKG